MSRGHVVTHTGWALFVLLSSAYLITYRGLFHSVDELALFSTTESLAQRGSTDTPQLAFARYHNWVGRLEPLQSALAVPLYWLAVSTERLGNIQTVMLFNVLVSAGTGALLYALLRTIGHPGLRASTVSLIYGLATIAWPYSRSFYREPLLALLLTAAALCFSCWRKTGRSAWAVAALLCLGAMPATKMTGVMAWPAFAVALVLEPRMAPRRRLRRLALVVAVGVAGMMASGGLYAFRTGADLWNAWGYVRNLARPAVLLERIYALTVGPARGLFVFSPALLLALPGMALLWHRERSCAWLSLLVALFYVVGYSTYSAWHAGMSWGPRFLVPAVPLLMLPIAEWLSLKSAWSRAAAVLVGSVSLAMQFTASTVDYSLQVEAGAWENMLDYGRSPAVQQFAIWKPQNMDMLWCHGSSVGYLKRMYLDGWMVVLPVVGLVGAAVVACGSLRGSGWSGARPWVWSVALGVALVGSAAALLLRGRGALGGYPGVNPAELRQVAAIVNQDQSQRVIVTVSNDFHLNTLLNELKGRFVHYWLSPLQEDRFENLGRPPALARRLWLIVDRVHLPTGSTGRDAEHWLDVNLHRYAADWVGSGYPVIGYLYPSQEMPIEPVDYRWLGGLSISGYGVAPRVVFPGDPVWFEFRCLAIAKPDADYSLFVQLLSPDGRFIHGIDGPPQFGVMPTSRWSVGQIVIDRRALFVPEGVAPGHYRLIAGLYVNDVRQQVVGSSGSPVATHVELGQIEVKAR